MDDTRGQHHWKDRPDRKGEGARADRNQGNGCGRAHRTRSVNDGAQRHLSDQGDKTANGEDEANIDLRPFLAREIDGDERPEAGLDIGDKEDKPIETPPAPRRDRSNVLVDA